MEQKIEEFEEFEYNGYNIQTDLPTSLFDGKRIHLEGEAEKDGEKLNVVVTLLPEDTPEFNNSISASEGKVSQHDMEQFSASLVGVEESETAEKL